MALTGRREQREHREDTRLALARLRLGMRMVREDLNVLADRLDDSPPWLDGDASTEWKRSVGLYASARASLREVRSLRDVLAVQATVREAWFHLARADALGYDEDPPTSSEPCFFDSRHGPAVARVLWAPPGEQPVPVDVCRQDAEQVVAGFAPRMRRLQVGGVTHQAAAPEVSPVQRRRMLHARGGGGYAQSALYAGSPSAGVI